MQTWNWQKRIELATGFDFHDLIIQGKIKLTIEKSYTTSLGAVRPVYGFLCKKPIFGHGGPTMNGETEQDLLERIKKYAEEGFGLKHYENRIKMKGQNIGYVRVSTVEQNTARQLHDNTIDKVFTDKCSGKDTNRPQLALMLEFVREGDTVIVHSMDRLARNLDDLRKLVKFLTGKGVKIQFIKENLIFTGEDSPMSTLLLAVMGAFAEFERSLLRERQKEGIAVAKKSSKYKGRKKRFTDDQVVEIKKMVTERYKITEIAKKYGVNPRTIYRYLNNEKLQQVVAEL